MPESSHIRRLNEVATIIDSLHKTPAYTDRGYPMVRVTDVKGGFLDLSGTLRVSEDVFREFTRRHIPQHGDIVFSRVGTYGNASYVATNSKFCLGQNTAIISPHIPSRYLHFFLQSTFAKRQIEQAVVGSTQRTISLKNIGALQIPVPSEARMLSIAHILGTLDDKIELNRRMNQTLEAIARAIFKSWFIDFDPIHAKAEGRAPVGMGPESAALFPDSFQDSPLGKIPKGWRISRVGGEFNLTMGQSPPGSTYNEKGDGLPFFQGRRDFGFRYPTKRVFCTDPKRIAKTGDTLVSVRAPVGDVNMASDRICVGRGLAGVRHRSGSRSYTYYSMLSLQSRFREYESEGTVFGAINKAQFSDLEWVSPPNATVEVLESWLFAVDERIELNDEESAQLAVVRDSLLLKLMSDDLWVKDTERSSGRFT